MNLHTMDSNTVDILTSLEQFKIGLMQRATGGQYENQEYIRMRNLILSEQSLNHRVPQFLKSCRNLDEFWVYIKAKHSTYEKRRTYLTTELNSLIEAAEQMSQDKNIFTNSEAYEIGERIGDGGFGEVYKYHHKLIDLDFAIKVLNPVFVPEEEKAEYNKRFFREAKILFELDHPNIVKVYDTGIIREKPFIRMEFIIGLNMDEFLKKYSKVSFTRSLKPIIALLEGLSYAHKKNIIHRDLKPRNYMVTQDGRFKIIDFGISAYVETELHTRLTRTGEQIAGGLYTDPELIRNPKLKDVRSDIYSVGALWFYLLTGRAPVGGDVKQYLIDSSDVTELQADLILKCLSQDINNRYSTCDELLLRIKPPESEREQSISIINDTKITEVTRMDLFEYFNELYNDETHGSFDDWSYQNPFHYYGRRSEIDFLNRIYNLTDMPSNDSRVKNFEEEIWIHRVDNNDWPEYWIFNDERLGLEHGNDETLLKFLCQMFHPVVRNEKGDWQSVLANVNRLLLADGYEIYESEKMSNRSVYSYRVII
jgi:serine/threonine protein kinase